MKFKYLFMFLFMMLIPFAVNADNTLSVSINCSPNSAEPGETSNCLIQATTNFDVSRVTLDAVFNSAISASTYTSNNSFTGSFDQSTHKLDVHTSDGTYTSGNFNIGTIKVTIAENPTVATASVALQNIKVYDSDGTDVTTQNISTSITINGATTLTGLKTLNVSNGTLSPSLTAGNYGYIITLNSSSTTSFGISAVANNTSDTITFTNGDTNATISNPSNITFSTTGGKSEMLIKIAVGSETYNITVRKPTAAASNELETLKVGSTTIPLTSGKYDYEITLANANSYEVSATLKDSTNFKISNMTLPATMSGPKEFAIIVSPKDSTSGYSSVTYTIKVKAQGSSSGGSSGNNEASGNPQTGGMAIPMAIALIISFGLSMYLYRKNIEGYN